MNNKYIELSQKYNTFTYEKYDIKYLKDKIEITYYFTINNLCTFTPKLEIEVKNINNKNKEFISYLVFNIGMIELISYWKSTCSKNIVVKCGHLSNKQVNWFKKTYFYGLGEFFYINNIDTNIKDFVNIVTYNKEKVTHDRFYKGEGNLIPVGGGKDSNVTLELLKNEDNTCFAINPKNVHYDCIGLSGIQKTIFVNRTIDKKLIELNNEGFLNGHTPFSALVSFVSLLCAYLANKKYIVLSNEGSANESTVIGQNINHQYSKSYEYEKDFNYYVKKYLKIDIKYFSILRCLNELQIALLFSKYKKYHQTFRSCNLGSKNSDWQWCGNCPKCLFTFIILSAFMDYDEVIEIFNKDLLNDGNLIDYYKQLLGETKAKPFECVGTIEETKIASSMIIKKQKEDLPLLLKYYKENYKLEENNILKRFNKDNNCDEHFIKILKEELNKYVR